MGILDKLKELAIPDQSLYRDMLSLEGDEFEKAVSAMLENIPNATSSNAHNKEMEMFLYKLFGKETIEVGKFGGGPSSDLFTEFVEKGYPLAQELRAGGNDAYGKIYVSQSLLDNPFAREEQKETARRLIETGFYEFRDNIKEADSKATSKDALLEELEKLYLFVPELDPKYVSPEQGQHIDKDLAFFMNKLRQRSGDTLDGSPSPLAEKSLQILEEFAKNGYPSAQEQMAMIADSKNDKKALNYWAKQVEKNPFSTEEQKKNAHDDVKDTQAFVAQSQARGGR